MRLLVKNVDMRGGYQGAEAWKTDVLDEETSKIVGWVHPQREPDSPAFRLISLFGGKYQAEFSSSVSASECGAFAKGVEAVLNHMLDLGEQSTVSSEAT
jgi:hypothetical protein